MKEDPLSVENTMWANTVLASGVYIHMTSASHIVHSQANT